MSDIADNYCGVVRTYHDDAKINLYEEYFINAGKKEGVYRSYHSDGQLWEEVNYIDGKKNGICKSYYSNGQLYEEVNYINDKENGIYKRYWNDGKLAREVNYIDGIIKGYTVYNFSTINSLGIK